MCKVPKMTQINFKLPDCELETLERYATTRGRKKSDVLREFIRSLEAKQ